MAFLLIASAASLGQATRESEPAKQASGESAASTADRSLLVQLNRETQGLYRELQGGVFRVQIPEAAIARNAAQNNWILNKYGRLNNEMRHQLAEPANYPNSAANSSATPVLANPASNGGGNRLQNDELNNSLNNGVNPPAAGQNAGNLTIIVPATAQEQQAVQNVYAAPAQAQPQGNGFSPNNIGLLLDDRGHVLVPQYVDREAVLDQPIHLTGASGAAIDARLVGSDQQTGLTVLQLVRAAGTGTEKPALQLKAAATTEPLAEATTGLELFGGAKPVKLARDKPVDGSLVLLLSPGGGTGKLGVWNGGGRDYGVVVNIDGEVAGITRYGQFLGGAACQLIADQIIRNGAVRRATLGVIITQIEKEDALRRTQPLLGDRPAVRVDEVVARSVAERGGLKQGDILLSLDGEPASDIPTLAAAIAAKNGSARVRVLRGDQVIELTVDLQRK